MDTSDNNPPPPSSGSGKKKKDAHASSSKIADLAPPRCLVQKYPIRPAPLPPPPERVRLATGGGYHALDRGAWMKVFSWLGQPALLRCSLVAKAWHRWALHPSLWQHMSFTNTRLRTPHLIAIVKRQPRTLDLSWTNLSYRKLDWLLGRLPYLRHLDVTGCSWAGVCALCSPSCPLLETLDVSWVGGLISACVRDLVTAPSNGGCYGEHRAGVDHSLSRLHRCTTLRMRGANISTPALQPIATNLPALSNLSLDFCVKLSDDSIATIARLMPGLKVLSLSKCHGLTTAVFEHLRLMVNLERLEMQNCMKISQDHVQQFAREVNARFDESEGVILFTKREQS